MAGVICEVFCSWRSIWDDHNCTGNCSLTFPQKIVANIRTQKMELITLPKKVIPLAELSIMEVVLALKIPTPFDFLNRK